MSDPCPRGGEHQYRKTLEKDGWIEHTCRKCGDVIRRQQTPPRLPALLSGPDRAAIERRFWAKVDKRSVDDCWEWTGARQPRGYGTIRIDHRTLLAHRVSFVLAFGWEPPATLHECDNPPCSNPRHLLGGTQADSMRDSTMKWRGPSRVTPAIKATILALAECGMTKAAIARQVNLHEATVRRTLAGTCNPGSVVPDGAGWGAE